MFQVTPHGAILMAADHIEQHPELFNFYVYSQPDHVCGTPACVLGWIAFFAGIPATTPEKMGFFPVTRDHWDKAAVSTFIRTQEGLFYDRMDELSPRPADRSVFSRMNWRYDHAVCATALRRYAEKYHPVEVTK